MSESTQIYKEGKYVVSIDGRNYTVSQIKGDTEEINSNLNTYHISIDQAIQEVSRRMLNDKLTIACKDKPMSLLELSMTIKAHEKYMSDKFEVK